MSDSVTIGAVATKVGSGATPHGGANVYTTEGVAFIRSQNVLDNAMRLDNIARIDNRAAQALQGVSVEPGDVLLNITGDSIARCCVVDPSILPARVNQHVAIIRVSDRMDPRFLQRALVEPSMKNKLLAMSDGGTRKALTKGLIEALEVPCPDIAEQRAIADALGSLDDKIAANDRIATIAQDLADAQFMASFGQNYRTPLTIGELADRGLLKFGDGYRTKRAEHGQPGFRILRAGDIRDGRIIPEGDDFVSDAHSQQIGQKISRPGDVVMTTKGSVGRVAVVPPDLEAVVYSPQVCYFRVLDEGALDGSYLAAWFRSPDLQSQASQLMFKSDMAPYINLRDIRSLTVPVPDRAEQRAQGELQRGLMRAFHAAHSENSRLRRMRDELLPLLISGKVRVRKAEKIVDGVV